MKWDVINFFKQYANLIPVDGTLNHRAAYEWGCDELQRMLIEGATLAQEAGNTKLLDGFDNLCIKPKNSYLES